MELLSNILELYIVSLESNVARGPLYFKKVHKSELALQDYNLMTCLVIQPLDFSFFLLKSILWVIKGQMWISE